MTTYRDFEDLRDNAPAAYKAEIAIDLGHADKERLSELWAATTDGEFRLTLTGAAGRFWERNLRLRESDIPEDHFAVEVVVDSYADPEMGHTIYLDAVAYCGSEEVGEQCWEMLADDDLERDFAAHLIKRVKEFISPHADPTGLECQVEVVEVSEL